MVFGSRNMSDWVGRPRSRANAESEVGDERKAPAMQRTINLGGGEVRVTAWHPTKDRGAPVALLVGTTGADSTQLHEGARAISWYTGRPVVVAESHGDVDDAVCVRVGWRWVLQNAAHFGGAPERTSILATGHDVELALAVGCGWRRHDMPPLQGVLTARNARDAIHWWSPQGDKELAPRLMATRLDRTNQASSLWDRLAKHWLAATAPAAVAV